MSFAQLKAVLLALLACVVVCACDGSANKTTNINSQNLPDKNLKVVIIRHGESLPTSQMAAIIYPAKAKIVPCSCLQC